MKIKEFSIAKMIVAFAATIGSLFARGASFEVASQADIEKYAAASGGDEVRKIDNGDGTVDFIHIFTNTAQAANFIVPAMNAIRAGSGRILVVGGGGAGSGNCGGGGGAGGLIYQEGLTVGSGTVTVGAGGVCETAKSRGTKGGNTVLTLGANTYTAIGGGTAGLWADGQGTSGGSGGAGSGGGKGGAAEQPDSASGGFGNVGGDGSGSDRGGGGGGAGSPGSPATDSSGGKGGDGLSYDISGESKIYAAGGGGGNANGRAAGAGGSNGVGGAGTGAVGANGGAGKPGTGSGGGGGGGGGGNSYGGAGGSGVVIIRYTVKNPVEVPENVKNKVYSFKDGGSGTLFNLPKAVKADILVVGGGGAGANPGAATGRQGGAGGGGAGGMIEANGVYLEAGSYDIIVGNGGISPEAQGNGGNGESSKILLSGVAKYEAIGGGGGGIKLAGNNGGSGGGGSKASGGAGVINQGHNGGAGSFNQTGAGGGGAGGAGGNTPAANVGGAGGPGKVSSITGTEIYYAAGGGGGTRDGDAAASGGSGIGGNGGYSGGAATNGRKNTGSGGGGGSLNTKGGNGGSGIVVIRIIDVMPDRPNDNYAFDYDGEKHVLYKGGSAVTIIKDGEEVSEIAVKDVGIYNYEVTLKEGYKWGDLTDNSPVNVTVTVGAPQVTVESISIEQWQAGQTPKKPNVVTTPFQVGESDYVVKYSPKGANSWTESAPTEAGEYDVTIEFKETDNFTVTGSIPVTSVTLWAWNDSDKYLDSLGYHSKITINANNETPLVNFPMLIKIKEGTPKGFEYKYANPDGSDIRFIDSEGNILAHEFDTWDIAGESFIWVKVPKYFKGSSITMCWGELVDKKAPAAIDPKEVWTAYLGVWHMDDAKNSLTGTFGTLGTNNQDKKAGVIGNSLGKTSAGANDAILTADTASNQKLNELNGTGDPIGTYHSRTFTASFWVSLNGNSNANAMFFSRKSRVPNNDESDNQWGFALREANHEGRLRFFLKDESTRWDANLSSQMGTGDKWYRMDVIFDDAYDLGDGDTGYSAVWLNGALAVKRTVGSTFASCTEKFRIGRAGAGYGINGYMDEVRIMPGTAPQAWIEADYRQVTQNDTIYTYSPVEVTPGAYFKNRWLRDPSVTKVSWLHGEEPTEVDKGEPLYGEAYYTFTSITSSITNSVPTEFGGYVFVSQVDGLTPVENGAFGYEPLRGAEVDVVITNESPDSNLGGVGGNPTLAGRVLLANDWGMGEGAITGQDYSNTNSANSSYWVHNEVLAGNELFPYLRVSDNSRLLSRDIQSELCDSAVIWHLDNVRIGNWYLEGCPFNQIRNYLPWSSDALPNGEQSESSHLVVRNIEGAAIYSPCYTNGIGTIYFDAVNALATTNGANYKLVVEICTNTTNGVSVPSDENIGVARETSFEPRVDEEGNPVLGENGVQLYDEIPGYTNRYEYADWKPVKMSALKRNGTPDFESPVEVEELALDISNGGTAKNFYRVYVKLNYNGPIRFRIRRASASDEATEDGAFILIDNVIASYPSMRMDLESYGTFDPAKLGKNTLGFEGAFDVPFPSVKDDIVGRGKPRYTVSAANPDADTSNFVVASKMFYRWRYLEQQMNEWQGVVLDHNNGFNAVEPLKLEKDKPGDIEYYFVSWLNAPFYDYVDYSGTDLKLGGYYSENTAMVTNRLNSTVKFESCGNDWFIRLREGSSNYERINLVITEKIDDDYADTVYKTNSIPMELIGEGMWRAVYQTLDKNPNGIGYRLEFLNEQIPGATEHNLTTNYFKIAENWTTLPVSDKLTETAATEYSTLPVDGVTGYLLFQIDEKTKAMTIVRADYQNFNTWNDANNKNGAEIFVGNSTEDEGKTGASPKSIETRVSATNWVDMARTSDLWRESFDTTTTLSAGDYVQFANGLSPNGWNVNNGMFVYSNYKDSTDTTKKNGAIDRALQMMGNGLGNMEIVDSSDSPRGIETISFNARLAQKINFDEVAYYDGGSKSSMSNYTVVVAGAFDAKSNTTFRGNASLSIFAHYRSKVGAYELRVEQIRAKANDKNGSGNYSAATQGQRLSFYRWRYDGGKLVSERIGYRNTYDTTTGSKFNPDKINWPKCNGEIGYQAIYFSVSNCTEGVCLAAGILNDSAGVKRQWSVLSSIDNMKFNNIVCIDNTSKKITAGTYGFSTANSEGVFARPKVLSKPVSIMPQIYADRNKLYNKVDQYTRTAVIFPGEEADCCESMANDEWSYFYDRFTYDREKEIFKAVVPTQTVEVYTAPAGKNSPWTLLTTKTIDTFGKSGKQTPFKIDVYSLDDCSIKIAAGGSGDSVIRTDIVIDDIEISQFRGGEWDDAQESVGLGNWKPDTYQNGYTNFVFTTAWIRDGAIMLSAKRTKPNDSPSSIRGPLYDGRYTSNYSTQRGLGLGMFSFKYKNAHPDVVLKLQIATNNVSETVMTGIDRNAGYWTDVTNFTFKTFSDAERKEGIMNCYLGLHGVRGVMRLVMDSKVVESSQSLTDPAAFPEIYITEVYTRDEPMLDYRAWWGWNLRTLGEPEDREKRMYLYDRTSGLPNGMSLALNNSVTDDVYDMHNEEYKQYQPFVQTPTFATNVVGEISFKARKYDVDNPQPAQVTVYGSYTGSLNSDWVEIGRFIVSNSTYTTYTKKTEPGKEYKAFRLAVTGVRGVISTNPPNYAPEGYDEPVRVLIDEVLVSEAIRARFEFRRVGAFRTGLDTTTYIPNVPSVEEQPMAGESWGVQCEIYPSQLADEIDLTRKPVVKLHWFEGEVPWGYNNWRSNNLAKSAYLAEATDTNRVYRSGYRLAQDAVIETLSKSSTIVQYELEVIYYTIGSDAPQTNYLSEARSWVTPEWYRGVDKNAGKECYTAYSILDSVAPGWAWINEVNISGEKGTFNKNEDRDYQYIEIATPAEANMRDWAVKLVEKAGSNTIITNTLAIFGYNNLETTKNLDWAASNMVFRVIGNQAAMDSGRLKKSDGTIDAVWTIKQGDYTDGEIWHFDPIGVQLVRPSGIIEHEVVLVGQESAYEPDHPYYEDFDPTVALEDFNRLMPGSRFIYIGSDNQGAGRSLSVMSSHGETADVWFNDIECTPGRINKGQQIDPDHPTPNGTSILLFAYLDTAFGHISQTLGDIVETNGTVTLVIPKGSERGTNITYKVDRWYDFAGVTTNGVLASWVNTGPRTFTATVGVGASNNVTVVASAKLSDKLVDDYGLGPDNKYRDAVVDWLEKGESLKFGEWANPDSDDIKLAEYQSLSGNFVTNLTLTQMYWLDIDPTAGDFLFRGGMVGAPQPITRSVRIDGVDYLDDAPNFKMGVKLYITNRTENVDSMYYNQAWAPYVLRGRGKGENSLNYTVNSAPWTNVTFKITGFLNNGYNKLSNKDNWIPQRWFVFTEDSFDENFETQIEIRNPFGKNTPGYSDGWYDWHLEHPNDALFFSWSLDTRLRQFPVEPLRKKNYYKENDYEP